MAGFWMYFEMRKEGPGGMAGGGGELEDAPLTEGAGRAMGAAGPRGPRSSGPEWDEAGCASWS